jgi:hypothetical protein
MDGQTKEHLIKNGFLTTTVWRDGKNLGMAFSRLGGSIQWDDMKFSEKVEVIQNLYSAADFFAKILQGERLEEKKKEEGDGQGVH